ncbi:NACHT domain-containing protein [Actinoplanes italicus]|uniref:NACHT domain-containing protein n=1 Tax=Actinoplanes italicus TaxID=113567 RepID=UPI0014762D7A|nr:NACHT domain-containing protein [Actinoplanes italicus]
MSPAEQQFADLLATAHLVSGLTQVQVAHRAHVSASKLSETFRARYLPAWGTAWQIATVLDVPEEEARRLWVAARQAQRVRIAAERVRPSATVAGWDAVPVLPAVVADLMRAQARAAEALPYQLFGPRRPALSAVYVRQMLGARQGAACSLESALARDRHLVLVGGPGQGKSTLTLELTGRLARRWLGHVTGDELPPVLPLRVTARQLAGDLSVSWPTALVHAVAAELGGHLDRVPEPSSVADLVGGVEWLLLIDGLDEIPDPGRRARLLDVLAGRMAEPNAPHRVLVTTRPLQSAELDQLDSSAQYALEPLDTEALDVFAARWFAPDRDRAHHFLREAATAGLLELIRVPLMAAVTAVVFQHDPDRPLPLRRFDLYERYTAQALAKAAAGPPGAVRPEHYDRLLEQLGAAQIESDEPLLDVALAWLTKQERNGERRPPDFEIRAEDLLTRSGLLVRHGRRWEFLHFSFAEHFAAAERARQLPEHFDPTHAALLQLVDRAADFTTPLDTSTVIHYARMHPGVVPPMMDWLLNGPWRHRQLAAHLLGNGLPGTVAQRRAAVADVEHEITQRDDGQPTWLLADLARIDPIGVSALTRIADNPTSPSWVRASAIEALVRLPGHTVHDAADSLRALARDDQPVDAGWARCFAGSGLFRLAPEFQDEGIHLLRSVLTDPHAHPDARFQAATRLVWSGVPHLEAEAAESLRTMTSDPCTSALERQWAARGLAMLGRDYQEEAAAALDAVLADPAADAMSVAATVYGFAVLPRRFWTTAVATFRGILADPGATPEDRQRIAGALTYLGVDFHDEAAEALRRILAEPCDDLGVLVRAADTLYAVDAEAQDDAIAVLRRIAADAGARPGDRQAAVRCLVRLDPRLRGEAVERLRTMAAASTPALRVAAAVGLVHITTEFQPDALAELRAVLTDGEAEAPVRVEAGHWLLELRHEDQRAVVTTLRALMDSGTVRPADRAEVARILARTRLDHHAAEVAAGLAALLAHPEVEPSAKVDVAYELGRFSHADLATAGDHLNALMNDPEIDVPVRRRAAQRLAKIDPGRHADARAAIAELASGHRARPG